MGFEVASIKPIPHELWHPPNFPLDNRNAFVPGGRFSAVFPLWTYISFAYKLPAWQRQALAQLPAWVGNSNSDSYGIEARAAGSTTKDQMRLMMQSLLADRCKLAVHFETREVRILALTLVKPGKLGPKLHPHSEGPPCPDAFTNEPPHVGEALPPNCGTVQFMDGHLLGARDHTTSSLADAVGAFLGLDRPVVDQTGLNGTFDFLVEVKLDEPAQPNPGGELAAPQGTLPEVLREQLGLKLTQSKAAVQVFIIDHVERPSEN